MCDPNLVLDILISGCGAIAIIYGQFIPVHTSGPTPVTVVCTVQTKTETERACRQETLRFPLLILRLQPPARDEWQQFGAQLSVNSWRLPKKEK